MALALPEVLGTGYGFVQQGLANELAHLPLVVVLALPFARILATALSIGTGGSGGVFGPGMVIGAFTGLAVWRVLDPLVPGVGHDPASFVLVGMMATFGGISRAPVAVMLMVAQMTGSLAILGPAMAAVALSWFVVRQADDSIYRAQLRTRADSPAGRMRTGLPLLATVKVGEVAAAPTVVVSASTPVPCALARLRAAGVPGAPVVDAGGTYVGSVELQGLEKAASRADAAELAVGAVTEGVATTVDADASLDAALDALVQAGGRWVAVTSGDRRVAGVLSVGDLVRGLSTALSVSAGSVGKVSEHAVLLELSVAPDSPLAGCTLAASQLPASCVVVTVVRRGEHLAATGSTRLEAGDLVSVLVHPEEEAAVRALFLPSGDGAREAEGPGPLV
jgi:CIC family chloride channel protein